MNKEERNYTINGNLCSTWDKDKVTEWLRANIIKYAKLKTLHTYADNHGTIATHFRGFNTSKLIEDLTKAMESNGKN